MGGFEVDRGCPIVVERVFPARHADAPFVARLETRKTPFWLRCYQIVAVEYGEIEKFTCDLHANSMESHVFGAGAAETVTIKSGHGIAAAAFQFRSEDVCGHNVFPNAAERDSGSVLIQTQKRK